MKLIPRTASEIRVAVAGLGKMGGYHTQALRQLASGQAEPYYKIGLGQEIRKVRVVGICDRDPSRGAPFPEMPFFDDFHRMLREARPDLLVLATPSVTHHDLGLAALAAGVHCFIEKPVATSLADWNAMEGLARERGLRLMAGHVERYNPVAIKIRQQVREGMWKVRTYAFRRTQTHDPRIPDDIVTDKLIHDLDLALYFFGPVKGMTLGPSRRAEGNVHELSIDLRHENGTGGTLFISWLVPPPEKDRRCRLELEDGTVVEGDFTAKKLKRGNAPVDLTVPGWVLAENNQLKDALADFIGHCLEPIPGEPLEPLLSLGEISQSTAIIEQVATGLRGRDN